MKTTTTPRAPALYVPKNIFMLELTVGVIPSLQSISVLVTDARFAFTPVAGGERQPVTASLDVDDPDALQIVNCVIVNEVTGQIRVRFANWNTTSTDFNLRFVTFFVWPQVAEP